MSAPGGGRMSFAQLRALAVQAGFKDPDTAAAIAMAESGGDPLAQGDPHGTSMAAPNGTSTSFGLWQIHTPAWPQFDATMLLVAEYNAKAAFTVFARTPGGFTAWSTYTTTDPQKSYKRFMPKGGAV